MSIPVLENWVLRPTTVSGTVTGHPRHDDGTDIRISDLVARNGYVVTTANGRRYRLGEAHEGVAAQLKYEKLDTYFDAIDTRIQINRENQP